MYIFCEFRDIIISFCEICTCKTITHMSTHNRNGTFVKMYSAKQSNWLHLRIIHPHEKNAICTMSVYSFLLASFPFLLHTQVYVTRDIAVDIVKRRNILRNVKPTYTVGTAWKQGYIHCSKLHHTISYTFPHKIGCLVPAAT